MCTFMIMIIIANIKSRLFESTRDKVFNVLKFISYN